MALKPARLQWSDDGQLRSLDYGDVYFQLKKGLDESRHVYLDGNKLTERFEKLRGAFHIAETGFGSGLNFLLTAQLFTKAAPADARLVYASIEKHPVQRADLEAIYAHFGELSPWSQPLLEQYPPLIEGFHTLRFMEGRVVLILLFGDITDVLPQLRGKFDAWHLDGFAPKYNPDMWTAEVYAQVAARTKPGGTVASFSSAGHVRRGLAAAGFDVKKVKGFGFKWSSTTAVMPGETAPAPLPKKIAVLGAGIAGCSAGHALAKRGHHVTLIDRHNDTAQETSGNPVGIVYPKLTADASPMGVYHAHAFTFTRGLLTELKPASWRACGVTHLDMNDAEAHKTRQILDNNGFPTDYAQTCAGGFHQSMAGFLSPPEFCARLADHPNITKKFAASVERIEKTPDSWRILGEEYDAVVMALGIRSKDFLQTKWLPLQSLRGQITMLKPTAASAALDRVICHDGYIAPLHDGLHCIGATFQKEEAGVPETRTADDLENLASLNASLPEFGFDATHIAGSRSGYRATTPDKLPIAGACADYMAYVEANPQVRGGAAIAQTPRLPGLYISTGFGAHGMTGAPLAGEIIAAEISGDPLPVPADLAERLQPERFIARALKRKEI